MTRILSLLTAVLLAAPAIGQVPEMKSADAKKIVPLPERQQYFSAAGEAIGPPFEILG